jgi:hypothetical protein
VYLNDTHEPQRHDGPLQQYDMTQQLSALHANLTPFRLSIMDTYEKMKEKKN